MYTHTQEGSQANPLPALNYCPIIARLLPKIVQKTVDFTHKLIYTIVYMTEKQRLATCEHTRDAGSTPATSTNFPYVNGDISKLLTDYCPNCNLKNEVSPNVSGLKNISISPSELTEGGLPVKVVRSKTLNESRFGE